ncbi:hypothetical protein [Pedobacter gandavensis]|uniref:hypothetical protein n=1 Tax=Pedobacter gandavensis TaxID=2679963 RepID=UPI002930C979|nr:hypothetical protein [Pedobacter gandavensis]
MMTRKLSLLFAAPPLATFSTRPQSAKPLSSNGISPAPATFNNSEFILKFIDQ